MPEPARGCPIQAVSLVRPASGDVYATQTGFADGENVARIQYISTCDVTGTAVRAIIPPEVTQGIDRDNQGEQSWHGKGKVAPR